MRFFFDNCMSPKLARAMHELISPLHEAVPLRQRWPEADRHSVADVDWIRSLGTEGNWAVISGDIRIRSRPAERDALKAARLTTFFLADGYPKLDKWEQVRWLIEKWTEIVDLSERVARGSTFRVPRRGKIETI